MPQWELKDFRGELPFRHPALLQQNLALAIDANLWHGDVRPFPCPVPVCEQSSEIVTYTNRFAECDCITFDARVDMVHDPRCDLVFWTGDGPPRMGTVDDFCSDNPCTWHVPCPEAPTVAAPVLSPEPSETTGEIADPFTPDICDSHPTAYRATFLTEIGNECLESHWSPPSEIVKVAARPNTQITAPTTDDPCVTKVRLYRLVTDYQTDDTQTAAAWAVVAEVAPGGVVTDNLLPTDLHRPDPISPDEFGAPPDDLFSVIQTTDGVFAGLSNDGTEVWYTLPGRPHSWRRERSFGLHTDWGRAQALVQYKEDFIAVTDQRPVWFSSRTGDDVGLRFQPDAVRQCHPVASLDSIVAMEGGIGWATQDGFILFQRTRFGNAITSLTPEFARDDWQCLDPDTLSALVFKQWLFFSTSVDSYMIDIGDGLTPNQAGDRTIVGLNLNGLAIGARWHEACDDRIYFSKDNVVYEWPLYRDTQPKNHCDEEIAKWCETCCPFKVRLPIIDTQLPLTFTRASVDLSMRYTTPDNTLRFKLVENDCDMPIVRKDIALDNCKPFPLRGCIKGEEWYVELEGCVPFRAVRMATSLNELRGR